MYKDFKINELSKRCVHSKLKSALRAKGGCCVWLDNSTLCHPQSLSLDYARKAGSRTKSLGQLEKEF